MFGRIRSSLTGEPLPEEMSPHKNAQDPQTAQRPGWGIFSSPPLSNTNGASSSTARNASLTASPEPQRSFFGSWGQPPSPSVEASPGTVRRSAAALLKIATPPPLNAHPEMNPNAMHDGVDDVDLAQRDTLEYQINRRDAYITKLKSDLHRMQTQLGQYTKDNSTLRRQQLESTHRHGIAIKLWRRTNDGLNARVECFENETTPTAAREIANLIRDAAPPNKDSAYLMMLQDQLTKATVKLDHLGSQTEIVLHKGEEVVESLREEMNEVIRERCRMELELLDQEQMLEDDMKRMVVKTERRLKRVQGEIDYLEKNAVEVLKNQEEDEEGGDEEEGADDVGTAGEGKPETDVGSNNNKEEEIANEKTEKDEDEKEADTTPPAREENGDSTGDTVKKEGAEDNGEGDESESNSESGSEYTSESSSLDNNTSAKSEDIATTPSPINNDGKKIPDEEQSPDTLRTELRKLAVERDRTLSVLQKKLREKNEEFHTLMRLRQSREKAIHNMETEKRDREEWERTKNDV